MLDFIVPSGATLNLNLSIKADAGLLARLDSIITALGGLKVTLDELKAKVEAQTTVVQSVVTLLTDLAQRLRDAADDPAEIQAIADQVDANRQAMADAVVANTPST